MKKLVFGLALAAATSAMALSASRVGPVSTYGALKANGSKLSGTCPSYANSAVQVKGMSLFWSSAADSSTAFYTEKAVNRMVKEMGIEVIRFAMGVKNDFDKGRGYLTGGEDLQKAYLKNIVSAAVDNDIYVIIDWHTESADGYTNDAKTFFEYAAKEYGKYNNVIFEVWNEPKDGASAATVATHANAIIPVIRKYSSNLVLVGSPEWSSHPEQCAGTISDDNYACTLHFYAATHGVGNGGYNARAEEAMAAGVPVFASEWGTVSADGNGGANESASNAWNTWMNTNKISWANWSASAVNEGSAAFKNLAFDNGLTFTTSGNIVKGYLAGSHSYTDCGLNNGGNSGGNGGFSTGVANGTTTDMIDDLEDGDRFAYTGGWWSAFADSDDDKDGLGATSISNGKFKNDFNKEVYDVLMTAKGEKNTSKYMAGIEGIKLSQGGYKYAPYVAIGLNLKRDTSIIDLSQCNSISYKFKGASHNFRVETSLVTNWNFHHVNKDGSAEWKEVELTWDQFNQEDWGDKANHFNLKTGMNKVQRFAWEVKGALDVPDSKNQPEYNYLYIDDVRCDGVAVKAISGGSAVTPASSSSGNPVASSTSVGASSNSVGASSNSVGTSSASVGTSSESVNPGVSSSAVIPASSSSVDVTPNKVILVIDDVEDGNEVANTTGTWYAYNDSVPGGKSSIANVYDPTLPGYVVNLTGTTDPTNGTAGFVGIHGIVWNQGEYGEAPFVALGLNLDADTAKGYDLSACEALSYRYKGVHHRFKIQDGQVKDYAYHEYKAGDATEWTTVVITWDKLKQPSWGETQVELNRKNITKMAWEAAGYKGFEDEDQPELRYLYVDDLTCMVYDPTSIRSVRLASGIKMSVQGTALNVAAAAGAKVQIFDMMGNLVKAETLSAASQQISLDAMGRGNYLVRVKSGREMKSTRISIR